MKKPIYINREISWLSFNERVLQEANDSEVPLIERLRFLGIFSNNRDEFFRVRVASVKRFASLGKREKFKLQDNPADLLHQIEKITSKQEKKFNQIFSFLNIELKKEKIHLINEKKLSKKQKTFVQGYFEKEIRGSLVPIILTKNTKIVLDDKAIYLAIQLVKKEEETKHAVIKIPENDRFILLPENERKQDIIMLDDIIRFNLKSIFKVFDFDKIEAYTFKVTRDAELNLDDDISRSWLDKMKRSVKNRKIGEPVRFVYDEKIPKEFFKTLLRKLNIPKSASFISGKRYHNFKDFMKFPDPTEGKLLYSELPPLEHSELRCKPSILNEILEDDFLISYPYQSFSYVIEMLREAAIDPNVYSIHINLYRVANDSKIVNALINAAQNGKKVTAIIELQARFDEKHNMEASQTLKEKGVNVIFGVPGLKVHSKLILIEKRIGKKKSKIAHVGTGNFHEGTAKIYGDYSLLTSDPRITKEASKVFDVIENNITRHLFRHLLVSPFNMRRKLLLLIDKETKNSKKGQEAFIKLKLNNLVDKQVIRKLYEASKAGVKIQILVRGICSLVPNVKGLSENIEVFSVVDRFLEHARVFIFCNNGDHQYFITSADIMKRNLDHRIEVTSPIYSDKIKKELSDVLSIMWKDNVKSRVIDLNQSNDYKKSEDETPTRSQVHVYNYYKKKLK